MVSRTGVTSIRAALYLIELAVLLPVVRLRLTRHGFQRAIDWSTTVQRSLHATCDEAKARNTVELARRAAQHVFRWHPVANKCLEQALLLTRFLARRGLRAELIIAVRKYPFESHAWARWRDVELTDPPDTHPEHFRVLARF